MLIGRKTMAHHALYPTRIVAKRLVERDRTLAASPAGILSYMKPAGFGTRVEWILQLNAVSMAPRTSGHNVRYLGRKWWDGLTERRH